MNEEVAAASRPCAGVNLRAWFTLLLLSIAYFLCLLDRQILTVLVDPIKDDLAISDTQFGLLQGMAFAVFYVTFSVPVARLADRWNRKVVIGSGLFLWSAATCCAGFARTFGGLFGARIGVGIGESCLAPAAYSMLADLFDAKKLGRIIGMFHTVGALGIAGSVVIGGLLYGHFASLGATSFLGFALPPWGMVLLAVGAPGVVLAFFIFALVPEPRRAARALNSAAQARPQAEGALLATLLADRAAFIRLLVGSSLQAIAGNATLTWAPAYLMRSFDMTPAQAGAQLGIAFAIGAIVGPLAGGAISDMLFKRSGNSGSLLVLVTCSIATAASYVPLAMTSSAVAAGAWIAVISVFYSAVLAVTASAIQLRAPSGLRAQISALGLCLNTVVGLGLGAVLVGLATDYIFRSPTAVGSSLAVVAVTSSMLGGLLIATLLKRS